MTAQTIRILYRLGLVSAHSGKYRLTANGQRLAYLAEKNRALAMRDGRTSLRAVGGNGRPTPL